MCEHNSVCVFSFYLVSLRPFLPQILSCPHTAVNPGKQRLDGVLMPFPRSHRVCWTSTLRNMNTYYSYNVYCSCVIKAPNPFVKYGQLNILDSSSYIFLVDSEYLSPTQRSFHSYKKLMEKSDNRRPNKDAI